MADTSRVQVRYVEEITWGTTPASALKNFRATGFSLKRSQNSVASEEIRSDSQVTALMRVGAQVEGEIPFEVSYGTLDDFLEGALRSDWQTGTGLAGVELGTDLLANGTTKKSYTIESEFNDITQLVSYTGCRVSTLAVALRPQSVITGSLGFMGKINARAATTVGTGAPTAANTNAVLTTVDTMTITEGGSAIDILGLDLSIAENLRVQPIIGQLAPRGIGYGEITVTGSLEAYFEDGTLLDKFLAFSASSLRVTITDSAGNSYVISLPAIKYMDGETPVSGKNQDAVVRLPFQAYMDATTSKTLRVTRNPA